MKELDVVEWRLVIRECAVAPTERDAATRFNSGRIADRASKHLIRENGVRTLIVKRSGPGE